MAWSTCSPGTRFLPPDLSVGVDQGQSLLCFTLHLVRVLQGAIKYLFYACHDAKKMQKH